MGTSVFQYNTEVVSIDLTYFIGVTKINTYQFRGCTNLQKVILPPNTVGKIDTPLRDCTSIRRVVIPHGVTILSDIITTYPVQVLVIIGDAVNGSSLTTISTSTTFRAAQRIVLYAETPPSAPSSFTQAAFIGFYVPDASVSAYKESWPNYAAKIFPVSEFVE